MTKTIYLLLILLLSIGVSGQETEVELLYNVQQNERYLLEKTFDQTKVRGGGSLQLPFFDDFSRFSLPTEDPEIPVDWQRWEDDNVYLNSTFPIDPPTIGVATMDGLDRTGYPYVFNVDGSEHIWSDTLTSMPIDLSDVTATDDVYLMFFYQPGGRGNSPDIEDSLAVEFYIDTNEFGVEIWSERWKIAGSDFTDFQQVFIPVTDPVLNPFLFVDDFRFRFRAKSEGSGNIDHWHIDFVFLDEGINPEDHVIQELAIMEPLNTLLNQSLTSMPWTHYISNPSGFMLSDSIVLKERNLNDVSYNFGSGFKVEFLEDGLTWDMQNDYVNTSGNESSIIDTKVPINVAPNNFVFDDTVNDTCAVFDISFYHEVVGDGTLQNDTMRFQQEFSNYYAHDDGSAESGWFLNTVGGQVAVKYQSFVQDTLLGLLIHFTPFREDVEDEIFLLRAWEDNGGEPGDQMIENFASHTPEFYHDGYNLFKYYEYDDPIPVNGSFFCGFVQSSETKLYVGNDKNTNTNTFNLFYALGAGASWQSSNVEGSIMIRPVLRAGKSENNVSISELDESSWNIYPNPAGDQIFVNTEWNEFEWNIMDLSGRLLNSGQSFGYNQTIQVSDLPKGIYLISIRNPENSLTSVKKFVKN